MNISDAQREVRFRFHGGFYGQLVSGVLWLLSGCLAVTIGVKSAIIALVFGGFMIFPVTESLVRRSGMKKLTEANTLRYLGMQVAFVLPFSMLLLLPRRRGQLMVLSYYLIWLDGLDRIANPLTG